jgi:hypothetical protein
MVFLTMTIMAVLCYAQPKEVETDFYRAFGEEFDFVFLKNIGREMSQAWINKNAKALGGYAALFFYAESLSGKKLPELTGLQLLEEATRIAVEQQDRTTLLYLANIWEEPYLGPGNPDKAKKIREFVNKTYQIKALPAFQKLVSGDKILFKVVTELGYEIPLSDLLFEARYGKFEANQYQSPLFPYKDVVKNVTYYNNLKDIITAIHLPTGKVAHAIIIVEQRAKSSEFEKSIPALPKEKKSLKEPSRVPTYRIQKRIEAVKFFAQQPDVLQKILTKSEAARVRAIDNLVNKVKQTLIALSIVDIELSKESFWAGVKTSEAYVYEEEPSQLRVTATVSADWIMESVRRTLQQQNIEMDSDILDSMKSFLPKEIEMEGVISLKE